MSDTRWDLLRTLLTAATLFVFAAALFGQATDSIIVGTVTDPAGMAVPNATITATNKDTNIKYNTDANGTGEYRLNNIPVGRYDISATASGFAMATVANVDLQLNHTSSVNLTLTLGTVSTSVEVQEAAATIDTATAQVQTTYDTRTMVEVPLAAFTRAIIAYGSAPSGFFNLSLLGAGVASAGGVGQGVGPSIAGQRPENNSFNLDGVLNNNYYATGPLVYVSNDAVSQFNLMQNQFSAEYGGASGGVFTAIVKTGTNQLHGSLFEYFQNRYLNAVDATEVQQGIRSNPRFDNNRFGGTVGGPIVKNKLFYFGSFEYSPIGLAAQPGQTVYAPTSAGLSILNSMPGISKTNLGVFEQFVPVAPVATNAAPTTVNGVNIPTGPLSFASPAYINQTAAVAAIDWNVSDKDQVRGRYYYSKTTGPDTIAALPVFFEPQPNENNMISISEFHNFSPTMENELRLSYARNNQNITAGNFKFPGLSVFPNLAFDDLQLQLGPDPNTPTGSIQNAAQGQENLTKTWGRHTFKAGYDFSDIVLSGYFVQRARGDYDYTNLQQFLLDQQPSGGSLSGVSGERTVGVASGVPFGFLQNAAYFNDDWRVRPNLTLNLGLRYEYVTVPVGSRAQQYSAPADLPGVITFAAPKSDKGDWAPRLGFAYSPGKNAVWSIRGGVARSFDNTYINLNENASPAYYATTVDVNSANPVSNFLANGGLQAAAVGSAPTVAQLRANISTYTFDQTRPYALTGTFGVQRLLAHDYTIEARYVYTKGVHLWNQVQVNIVPQVTPSNYIPTFFSMPSASTLSSLTTTLGNVKSVIPAGATAAIPYDDLAVYGFTSKMTAYHPWGNSRYNGLALQMNKRYSKNFSYIAAFTWSHNFDDSTATNFSTILSPRRAQNFQNLTPEWASSALDRRLRLTLTPTYDFKPFDKSRNFFLRNVVGNWNIAGTYTYQSPEYATVQSGLDSNLNGDSLDRSIINTAGAANVGSGVTGYNSAGVAQAAGSASIVAYVANNSNARYVVAGSGALANSGRNTFPLDPTNNIDAALMKRVNLTETKRIEFGVQAFNLFNHSQFVGGYLSEVNYFMTDAISRNFLIPSTSTFGQYSGYFSSNSRELQLVAHFTF